MPAKSICRFFPESEVSLIHQTGAVLSDPTISVEVILHTREDERDPCCAEIVSGDHYADIGLWFEGNELSDYDGVFCLPREVGEMLKEAGYVVPEDCFG